MWQIKFLTKKYYCQNTLLLLVILNKILSTVLKIIILVIDAYSYVIVLQI